MSVLLTQIIGELFLVNSCENPSCYEESGFADLCRKILLSENGLSAELEDDSNHSEVKGWDKVEEKIANCNSTILFFSSKNYHDFIVVKYSNMRAIYVDTADGLLSFVCTKYPSITAIIKSLMEECYAKDDEFDVYKSDGLTLSMFNSKPFINWIYAVLYHHPCTTRVKAVRKHCSYITKLHKTL